MMAGGRSSRMDDSASWLQAKKKTWILMGCPSSILPIVFTRNIFTCFQWFFQWPKWVLYLQHSCATSMYHLASCWPFGIQRGSNRPESPRKTIPKWWKEDMLELVLVEGNGMNVSLWSTCFQQLKHHIQSFCFALQGTNMFHLYKRKS